MKYLLKQKDDLLFVVLILATFIAGTVITIQSQKYNKSLYKINPNYNYPTLIEIFTNTTLLTFILFILKLAFEKLFYYCNDIFLLDNYKNSHNLGEKNKYKRKLSIYSLKFFSLFNSDNSFLLYL